MALHAVPPPRHLRLLLIKFSTVQSQKDIPAQFFVSSKPIHATVVIASFGSAEGLISDAFDISLKQDANAAAPGAVGPILRYGKQPQIHHIFREPTKYPNPFFPAVFSVLIAGAVPVLVWLVSISSPDFATTLQLAIEFLTLASFSGSASSAPTSASCPRPSARLLYPTPPFLARFWVSRPYTFCTTAACCWARSWSPWPF